MYILNVLLFLNLVALEYTINWRIFLYCISFRKIVWYILFIFNLDILSTVPTTTKNRIYYSFMLQKYREYSFLYFIPFWFHDHLCKIYYQIILKDLEYYLYIGIFRDRKCISITPTKLCYKLFLNKTSSFWGLRWQSF